MEVEKIRNLSDDELTLEERKAAEQLFRLRFQMKLGQTEGVKKLRELRKDIARIKTVARQRELGLQDTAAGAESGATVRPARRKAKPAKKKAAKKAARRTSARGGARSAAKPSANKKKAARSASVKKG